MTNTRPDFRTATFKTSTYTQGTGTCVEVAVLPGWAAIRDTKHRAGGHLTVPGTALRALVDTVRP